MTLAVLPMSYTAAFVVGGATFPYGMYAVVDPTGVQKTANYPAHFVLGAGGTLVDPATDDTLQLIVANQALLLTAIKAQTQVLTNLLSNPVVLDANLVQTQASSSGSGGTTSPSFLLVAAEALPAFAVVRASGASMVDLASAANIHNDFGNVIGVTIATAAQGAMVPIISSGPITDAAWDWAEGPVYLDVVAGGLTQTQPSADGQFVQEIGVAVGATTIVVGIGPATLV